MPDFFIPAIYQCLVYILVLIDVQNTQSTPRFAALTIPRVKTIDII